MESENKSPGMIRTVLWIFLVALTTALMASEAISGLVGGILIAGIGLIALFQVKEFKDRLNKSEQKLQIRDKELQDAKNAVSKKQHEIELLAGILPACVAYLDQDQKILYSNALFDYWFGLQGQNLKKKRLSEVLDTLDYTAYELILEEVRLNQEKMNFEKEFILEDGSQRFGHISLIPILDEQSKFNGFIIYVEDITTIKSKELSMRQMNYELEVEASERIKVSNRLVVANKELQQFAAIASHDMKEPLRTIGSFTKILSQRLDKNDQNQECLSFIQRTVNQMTHLIEDLVTYAKAGNYKEAAKVIELGSIVELVEHNLAADIQERNAQIIREKLPIIKAHFTPISQLFQNIISNALKFQQKGAYPKIEISSMEVQKQVIIEIKDNGIGMDAKQAREIFEPFRRLNHRYEYEGSGIGLATCKKIVDQYKGQIWVESKKGTGSSFFIALPSYLLVEEKTNQTKKRKSSLANR